MSKESVRAFLKEKQILADDIDLHEGLAQFEAEMAAGLKGEESSLLMIPTYISVTERIPVGEPVIVLDAGGTNFRVALLTFNDFLEPIIEDFQIYTMPGSQGEMSKEEFFDTMVDYLQPVIDKSKKIGFCFSYAVEIQPNRDGRILNFSKEVRVPEVIGELLVENLRQALAKRNLPNDHSIAVLNDTVAALLGGRAGAPSRVYDANIGFILGTGTNTAYTEPATEIVKIKDSLTEDQLRQKMIINTESGGYDNPAASPLDDALDATTADPGAYRHEKMISGRYQGTQALYTIRAALDESDLFSDFFKESFRRLRDLDSRDLDDFLYEPYGASLLSQSCANDEDRENLYYLLDNLFERAARLVAINLAAVFRRSKGGTNPVRPIAVTADGTTFYKSKLFRPKLDYYVRTFINEELGIYVTFRKVENANLIGAGIAGLTN